MRLEIILSSIAAVVSAQGVTQYLAPKGKAPKGCQTDLTGKYELSVAPLTKKQKRMAFEVGKTLQITLKGGVLTDALSRTGYIADNYQFQFDGPPQAGSIYTGGWSLCNNGSLALGPSTVFYQCLSGSFYNLYDRWWAQQCSPINIVAHSLPDGAAAPAAPALTASPDPLQSGSPDLPPGLASPSSPAKATSDAVGGLASVTLTNGAAPGAATTGLGASASALSSIDSSISSASSVSSSVSSSAASSLSSVSSSIKSSASSARSSASANASASNNGVQVGGTGASTVALLMGVIGMVLA